MIAPKEGPKVFKRNPRTWAQAIVEFFYPRGGWYRAANYVIHRIRRLPDPPGRIARGIAAGVFTCFTPFFGFHFITAAIIAWLVRGNLLAALMATFVGNPITFPFIAELSLGVGSWILGQPHDMHLLRVLEAFWHAGDDLWRNFKALFHPDLVANWDGLERFFRRVFLPYLVGSIPPGLGAALIAYGLSRPVLVAYQKRRVKQLRKRYEKRMAQSAAKADAGADKR